MLKCKAREMAVMSTSNISRNRNRCCPLMAAFRINRSSNICKIKIMKIIAFHHHWRQHTLIISQMLAIPSTLPAPGCRQNKLTSNNQKYSIYSFTPSSHCLNYTIRYYMLFRPTIVMACLLIKKVRLFIQPNSALLQDNPFFV